MSGNNNNNNSTLKSYMDSAAGAMHHGIGAMTGSETQKAKGDMKQAAARAEHTASHDGGLKGPGFMATSGGTAVRDDPQRREGKWNQTAGAAKETTGGVLGSDTLRESGRRQNIQGTGQQARGEERDWATGTGERVKGTVGSAAAGLTGNPMERERYEEMRQEGKARVRGTEHDMQGRTAAQREQYD
ncbi:hypothetical protein TD95_002051 [Thielaviopsis punctulata]|uniref:CsbD-like domain-containing protein n=1 Tax=Thielaviopsis punctulata TaxID=72032 RepID=A0A0F4ZGA7_9PEZI|nr:hypothetical protein TD95_002051 [Thielaviopsis punctulata]